MGYFRKVIEIQPQKPKAYNNLGVVLKDMNKVEEAIECFHKAIELDPKK